MAQNESSDCYEFDAPSYVIDLKELSNADKNADNWFEERSVGKDSQLATPIRKDLPFGGSNKGNLPKAIVCPSVKTDVESAPSTASSPPSNIVTSWGDGAQNPHRCKTRTSARPPAQPRRVSKRKEAAGQDETTSAALVPPKKQRRSSQTRTARRPSTGLRRSSRTQAASATQLNSSEAQELERIRDLQREVAEHRQRNEASYRAALAGSQPPKKQVLSTTIPKEFHFTTDSRIKGSAAPGGALKEVNFKAQLRKHPSSPVKGPKGVTVPKPFNLSAGHKRKVEDGGTYVPMAEQIAQFQKRTPDRYHLRSRQVHERGPSPVKVDQLKITQPHTPQLMTRQRNRPTTVKSTAELEEEEVDKLHKFKFKALELNRKILEGALNPKKPAPKELTKPEGFELHMDKRVQQRKKPEEVEERPHTFHSRPLPTKILEEVVGVPEKKLVHPTVPESPAFALKNRVRMERKVEEVKPPSPIKAHPVPHFGLPFQPRLPDKSQVEMCPFSFEERERDRRVLRERKLEQLRTEEVPKFKAQPLPDFTEVLLPEKKVAGSTKPEPFKLKVDERGAVRSDRWEQMVKEEQKRQVEAATFKAGPNTVVHKEPFQPKKENHTLLEGPANRCTVSDAFQLSTERRAKERHEFERAAMEKEALRAQMEEEGRRQEEAHAKEEVARLRQEQVHKAQPIRRYKPVELKKSDIALTVPQSPNFSNRFHL